MHLVVRAPLPEGSMQQAVGDLWDGIAGDTCLESSLGQAAMVPHLQSLPPQATAEAPQQQGPLLRLVVRAARQEGPPLKLAARARCLERSLQLALNGLLHHVPKTHLESLGSPAGPLDRMTGRGLAVAPLDCAAGRLLGGLPLLPTPRLPASGEDSFPQGLEEFVHLCSL